MNIEVDWEKIVVSTTVGLDRQPVQQKVHDLNAGKQDCQAWSLDTGNFYLSIYFYSNRELGSGSEEDCEK